MLKQHLRLILVGMVPILLSFILLYIIVLKNDDWEFVLLKVTKLVLYTSVLQFVFTMPTFHLIYTLKIFRFSGEHILSVIGAMTVWVDILNKTDKIITARFSRGFIKKRTFIIKAQQFPYALIPMVAGILRSASERASSWEHKNIENLLQQVQTNRNSNGTWLLNASLLIGMICWLTIVIMY